MTPIVAVVSVVHVSGSPVPLEQNDVGKLSAVMRMKMATTTAMSPIITFRFSEAMLLAELEPL